MTLPLGLTRGEVFRFLQDLPNTHAAIAPSTWRAFSAKFSPESLIFSE
ncbi:hypothetical protein [Brasilonema sennae]|jgi:hypothetical protein|nr:hypothetical protein [Brasilonema sennae]